MMATADQMTIERVRDLVLTTPPLESPSVGGVPHRPICKTFRAESKKPYGYFKLSRSWIASEALLCLTFSQLRRLTFLFCVLLT